MTKKTPIFTRLFHWIKRTLWVHMPLWICGPLGILVFFLPDSLSTYALVFLFGAYFLSRYLWRKHLKKQDKLGGASSGLFSLLYWGAIGLFLLFAWIIPETPKLAVYAKNADSEEHDKQRSGAKKKKRSKESNDNAEEDDTTTGNKLNAAVTTVLTEQLACDYAEQNNLIKQCSQVQQVELDNDSASLEVFVLSGDQATCETTDCNLWLVQISAKHFAAYQLYQKQEGEKKPWTPKAKTIKDWSKVKLPVRIEKASHNGWRKLQITQSNGQVNTWRQPIKQNPVRKKSKKQKVMK